MPTPSSSPVQRVITDWREQHFNTKENTGDAADLADPDRDGLVNLIEFAFNLDPNSPSAPQLPQATRSGNNFVITFNEPPGTAGITYGARSSTNLEDWAPVPDTGSEGVHTFSVPIGSKTKLFLELVATIGP